ncbi:hypothetical protein [Streptomyces sp. DH37]|uniref:hypothetical protein n=1 Tax=Streptomyces sp. DH37 TaxID=3040122 RepID=UPI0024422BBE|nr:hypothetical protein [Streptomyces sp. DH37]MDG9705484.1 hypothetical protein [Streptomyces sp. DH37]
MGRPATRPIAIAIRSIVARRPASSGPRIASRAKPGSLAARSLFPAGRWYASTAWVSRNARLRSASPRARSGTAESSFAASGQSMVETPRA